MKTTERTLDDVRAEARERALDEGCTIYVVLDKKTWAYATTDRATSYARYLGCYDAEGFWTRYGNA